MSLPVPDISRNLFDLSGYCSIVTGAGQGIGLALAEALAYAGSDLVLTERNAEHLEVGASKIEAIGRKVTTVACDVAADDTPDRLVKAALDLSGRIDVLINNAGLMTFADMLTVEDAVWDNIYAVNVRAPMRIMRAVLPEMVKAKRGSVINIGSSWSSRASAGRWQPLPCSGHPTQKAGACRQQRRHHWPCKYQPISCPAAPSRQQVRPRGPSRPGAFGPRCRNATRGAWDQCSLYMIFLSLFRTPI